MLKSKFFQLKEFLNYNINAKNAHGLHSPFVFDFYNNVLLKAKLYKGNDQIEKSRKNFLSNHKIITIKDLGAGSIMQKSNKRKISEIAKNALKSKKYAYLLYEYCKYYSSFQSIVELGTSLGITIQYLYYANKKSSIYTLEGSPEILGLAREEFYKNFPDGKLNFIEGNFDDNLSNVLTLLKKPFLIYIDGNHSYEATVRYFKEILPYCTEDSVVIFDDLYWSSGMKKAWKEIIQSPEITMSIDVYQLGFVFFNKDFKEKQHFILKY